MSQPFSAHLVAQQLIAWEAEHGGEALAPSAAASRACTRLCRQFSRLVGEGGCELLMARALSRAAAEHPVLQDVRWLGGTAGSLAGLPERIASPDPETLRAALVAVVAAYLSLLARFIGEDLTRRQLERAWPELRPGNPATEAGA